jgi:dTDP-4-dehydrorhamnose reductase
MRVAVIGAPGQLGSDLMAAFSAAGHEPHALGHDALEVAELASVEQALERTKPRLVLNAAAFHRVDECEDRPWEAFRVNGVGAWNVARAAAASEAAVIYISTDYVFSGPADRPWLEDDLPEPGNLYGASKLAGEACTRAANPRAMVVRTSGLFGVHPCRIKGYNFVDLMLKLAAERGRVTVVSDEVLSPTYTKDLARAMVNLAEADRPGLYHMANQGAVSWYDFAAAVFEESGTSCELVQAPPGAFPKKAPRPANSSLASKRLGAVGIEPLRPWREALKDYLHDRRQADA